MGIRADAIPLNEPLEGGQEGAAVSVEPMIAGDAHWPAEFFEKPDKWISPLKGFGLGKSPDQMTTVPVPAFLIRHPGAGLIMVDTGHHPSVANNAADSFGRLSAKNYSLERGKDVSSQLRLKGLDPRQVSVVIMTHLHTDHASGISQFPDATFVFSAAEWKAATTGGRKMFRGYRPAMYDHAFDYRTIDFDGPEINSYGPLGRTFDLFGDGSVRVVFTPGHTAGHCSVVCRLPKRDFVIGGDVAYTWRQLEGFNEPYMVSDLHQWRRSLKEIQAYRKAYPYAVVTPGHDPEFYKKLEERYAE